MDRDKALEMALSQIDKQFGKGSIMKLGERGNVGIAAIPTGALALDLALGIGGLPRGRIVEIFGPESSGKSTLATHVVAEAQRNGGVCAYIDAEHAMDPVYAAAIGVNVDELLISQPDTGEQALEIADMLIRSGALDVLVIDSVAALVPRAEIEGEMGDSHMGLQARLMSQALRKLTGNLNKSRTIAIFINQLREKIGVMFGSPETTPGGRALKFYSSVRLDIRRIESIKDGPEVVGNRTRVKVVKNKCVAAGTTVFDPTTGLTHRIEDIVEHGVGHAVVAADKTGQLHVQPIRDRMDQGEQEVIGLRLRDNTELWVTPDHRVLTEDGWREAGQLAVGDRVARPRRLGSFGEAQPVSPDEARLIGYLVGDGYVGGKTPITFINVAEPLQEDAIALAAQLGCNARRRGIETAFSHRPGERNGVLETARAAGIWGKLAYEKYLPSYFFAPDVSRDVVANLLFGLLETDGYVSAEQTGAIRCGYTTTSEQLRASGPLAAPPVRCLELGPGVRPDIAAGELHQGSQSARYSAVLGSTHQRDRQRQPVRRCHPDVGPAWSRPADRARPSRPRRAPGFAEQLPRGYRDRTRARVLAQQGCDRSAGCPVDWTVGGEGGTQASARPVAAPS